MRQGNAALSKDRVKKRSPGKSRKPDRDAIVDEFLPSIRIHAARLKMRIPPSALVGIDPPLLLRTDPPAC